jgi:hypothetical protein
MADKTDIQVTCEWLAADKVQIKVILYEKSRYDSRGRNRIEYTEETNLIVYCTERQLNVNYIVCNDRNIDFS